MQTTKTVTTSAGRELRAHTFQTGRLYTSAGQRVAWVLMREGVVYLCDGDRLVDGLYSVPTHNGRAPSNSEVLNAYDWNMQPAYELDMYREARSLFDKLREVARELPDYKPGDPITRR